MLILQELKTKRIATVSLETNSQLILSKMKRQFRGEKSL